MNTPLDYIRAAEDCALTVPAQVDLRPYTVTLYLSSWSGIRQGLGTETVTQTPLYNYSFAQALSGLSDGYVNVKFRQVNSREIALSGGLLKDQDVVIGHLVFPYQTQFATGGTDPLLFSTAPNVGANYINVQGPNIPVGGRFYKKIWDLTDKNVSYLIYLRATDQVI